MGELFQEHSPFEDNAIKTLYKQDCKKCLIISLIEVAFWLRSWKISAYFCTEKFPFKDTVYKDM